MKNFCLLFTLILVTFYQVLAQESETILNAPESWRSEIINFPLGFAPSIDYTGYEDIRFAAGWSDPESPEFWMYTFVWYIDPIAPLTEQSLTETMTAYYDGLMQLVAEDEEGDIECAKTLCVFMQSEDGFIGKAQVYDAFFTKKPIALNFKVRESFCSTTEKQLVAFQISPKGFEDSIWEKFKEVTPKVNCK